MDIDRHGERTSTCDPAAQGGGGDIFTISWCK